MTGGCDETLLPADLAALDKLRFTADVDGETEQIGRLVFSMMFFMRNQDDAILRPAIVEAETYCCRAIGLDTFTTARVKAEDGSLEFDLRTQDDVDEAYAVWRRAQDLAGPSLALYDDISEGLPGYALRASTTRSNHIVKSTSTFQLNLPLSALSETGALGRIRQMFSDLCAILKPHHAQAGLCMATQQDRLKMNVGPEVLYPFLQDHPCLMSGWAVGFTLQLGQLMNSIGWITAIHRDLLSLCGGPDDVMAQTGDGGCTYGTYPEGMIIQIGKAPALGRADSPVSLSDYGKVARALRPARARPELIRHWVRIYGDYQKPGTCTLVGKKKQPLWNADLLAASQTEYLTRMDGL